MLRIIQNRNAQSAKGYYGSKAEAAYYAGGQQEMIGAWGGKAAERLGLIGDVDQRSFERLCDNRHPETGGRLTARTRQDRTPGYDFSFHPCKSASLLYALTGDPAILSAFRAAVAETMADMERQIQTRVRTRGRSQDRTVGNMAWAEFIHFTARPVGGMVDPHLHAHCFVFNAVFDGVEGRWKAGQFRELKAAAPRFQKDFHARFAWKLMELGYPIARRGDTWEVAGFDRATIEAFSQRTRQVERYAAARGITDPKARDQLGARTRERKRSDTGMDELGRQWDARLTPQGRDGLAVATAWRSFRSEDAPSPAPSFHKMQSGLAAWQRDRLDFIRRNHRDGDGSPPGPVSAPALPLQSGHGR